MDDAVQAIAGALEAHDFAFNYTISLERLVDGVATYRLELPGSGEVLELPGYAAAASRASQARRRGQASAALAAMKPLQDEVTYWRQDAAARLWMAVALARGAEKAGDLDEAARIRVSVIMPTIAALTNALSGDIYWPLCEGCSKPVQEDDALYTYEGGELVHVDCADPRKADPLPPEAHRHVLPTEFTPEGIAKTLAAAKAYLAEED